MATRGDTSWFVFVMVTVPLMTHSTKGNVAWEAETDLLDTQFHVC